MRFAQYVTIAGAAIILVLFAEAQPVEVSECRTDDDCPLPRRSQCCLGSCIGANARCECLTDQHCVDDAFPTCYADGTCVQILADCVGDQSGLTPDDECRTDEDCTKLKRSKCCDGSCFRKGNECEDVSSMSGYSVGHPAEP